VRKDLNFLKDTDVVMKLSPSMKSDFKRRLYKDKEFLKSCNLMDYSLLLITFSKKEIILEEEQVDSEFLNLKSMNFPQKVL
jgi:hypothetical protein